MGKSTEQVVTELADRDAIRELPQRYVIATSARMYRHIWDTHDPEAASSIPTDQGEC
jgi:hypothetical protein